MADEEVESSMESIFEDARKQFHASLLSSVLQASSNGIPSNADKDSKLSVLFGNGILARFGSDMHRERLSGQASGRLFETIVRDYLVNTFLKLKHLRPGKWEIRCTGGRKSNAIGQYEQYAHLDDLQSAAKKDRSLAAILQNDYTIAPDIVISRLPESDETINATEFLVGLNIAQNAALREVVNSRAILHASISCKWTIRSDRAQNSRSEALNLIRNRKGKLPHIVVVTGEPLPSRLASLALGTGDVDCLYHFALYELVEAVSDSIYDDAKELLSIMVDGKRLKDISDLSLDLAV